MEKNTIFTVGHSTHSLPYFLELLQSQAVSCIVDVRSVAASAYNPQFNKETLTNFLKKNGIVYMHFAKEFGARYDDSSLLDKENKVDFEKVRKTTDFKSGVNRLHKGIEKGYKIALMCSESEPFDCHRFSMVSVYLQENGFEVKHILKDKTLLSQEDLEKILLKKYEKKLPTTTIFEEITPEFRLKTAYRFRNRDIAYSPLNKDNFEEAL
jgi:uncharacterized protein (DUF488 family)